MRTQNVELSLKVRWHFGWCFSVTVFNYLWPHELQHARLPCPSLSPWVFSNACPLSQWCHPTVSFSVMPLCSCPQSLPTSVYFPVNQCFTSGGQSIKASASTWVLPTNIQGWLPLGLVWSPSSPRDSQEASPTPQFKSISIQPSFWSNSHIHTLLQEKP